MEQFLDILTKPDNIPIVGMVVASGVCLWVWLKQALKHDRLIREGKKDRIRDEMIR